MPAQSATSTSSSQDKRSAPTTNRIPSVVDKEPSRREAQAAAQNAPPSKPSTPNLANSTPARPETPKPSTLPSGNIPGLPKRPDVTVPGQGLGGRTHDRRDPAPRDSRDTRDSRGPREPRDHREPRESRDTREPRDQREARDARDPRDHRMAEGSRPERPARDSTATDRRGPAPESNGNSTMTASKESSSRPGDKDRNSRSEAAASRPSRDSARDPPREPASREALKELPRERGSFRGRENGRSSPRDNHRDGPAPPPSTAQSPPASAQEPTINPERARLLAREQPDIFQPERPGTSRDRRASPGRSPRDDTRGRNPPSRNPSPRSGERFHIESVTSDREREGLHGRTLHPGHGGPPGRDGYGEHVSHMPSRDRHRDREGDRSRDNMAGPAPSSRHSFDQDNGRLSYQDPNYGRLNHIPSVASEIPSGPRARGSGGREPVPRHSSLNLPGPSPRHDGRFPANSDAPRPPSPDRHPPTGPSSGRPPARRGRGQYEPPVNGPPPPSPANAPPPPQATGVHPDRIRQISGPPTVGPGPGSNGPGPGPAGGSMSANSIPINPDRMNQINASSLPPPPQPPRRSMGPPQQTPDRPPQPHGPPGPGSSQRLSSSGGPSHQSSGPGTDSRSGYAIPSGPSSSHDRTDRSDRTRGRGRTMLDGINTTLEKAGQESRLGDSGRSIHRSRGHGTMAGSDAQVLTGGSPATTPIQERTDPMRREMPGPRGSLGHHGDVNNAPLPTPSRESRGGGGTGDGQNTPSGSRDGRDGRDGKGHDRSSRREHRDRSGRPSRRSSRERSTDREREQREHRESRDRRSGAPSGSGSGSGSHGREGGDREASSSRRSGRESTGGGGREPLTPLGGGGRDLMSGGRESRHRGESRSDNNGGSNNGSGEWGGSGSGSGSGGGRGARSGGGSGGGPPRSGDDRREGSGGGREDRGSRKRRSDDAAGLAPNDRDKRQRR